MDSIRTKHLVNTSFRRIIHLSGLTILYTYITLMASGFGHIETNSSGFGYIEKKNPQVWIYRKKLYQLNVIFVIYIILCIYHLLCKYWYSFVSNTFLFLKINNYKNKYIIDRSSLYWTSEACFLWVPSERVRAESSDDFLIFFRIWKISILLLRTDNMPCYQGNVPDLLKLGWIAFNSLLKTTKITLIILFKNILDQQLHIFTSFLIIFIFNKVIVWFTCMDKITHAKISIVTKLEAILTIALRGYFCNNYHIAQLFFVYFASFESYKVLC